MLEHFRRWRETILDEKHKYIVVKRTIEHYKRHTFDIVARAFGKMVNRQRQFNYRESVKGRIFEQQEILHATEVESLTHAENKARHQEMLQDLSDSISLRRNTQHKLMTILERRNKEWLFISRKRAVFNALREAGKKHNGFC